ncbi:hypothetical protein E0K83_17135 [Gramella sp. BOM4]|nr:hypothetical protein [Christiangramia bathymodioli]
MKSFLLKQGILDEMHHFCTSKNCCILSRYVKKIPGLIFMSLHFCFLLAAMFQNGLNLFLIVSIGLLGVSLNICYWNNLKDEKGILKLSDLALVLFSVLGALTTFWLNIEHDLGAVLSAGLTGLFGSFIPFINRKSDILREIPVALHCGAFAGMTSPLVANDYSFILLAGLFSGLILVMTKTSFQGFGGKLGTIAFGGVCATSLILYFLG